jgi:hypothetical protein
MNNNLTFKILPDTYCYLHTDNKPSWLEEKSKFYTITKTPTELSIFCEQELVDEYSNIDKNWRVLELQGVFDLEADSSVGITAKFSNILAQNGINLCVIASFNTDYLLIKSENLEKAVSLLKTEGFDFA